MQLNENDFETDLKIQAKILASFDIKCVCSSLLFYDQTEPLDYALLIMFLISSYWRLFRNNTASKMFHLDEKRSLEILLPAAYN